MNFIRHLALAGALFCGIVAAEPPVTVALNIEPQPIRTALEKFADQTGLQVVLRDEDVRSEGMIASRVVGDLSVEQALGRLLAGTDLRYEFVNARTVKISRQDKATSSQPTVSVPQLMPPAAQMRLAKAGDKEDEQKARTDESAAEDPASARGIPEILVKGKRTLNADSERTRDAPQPYVIFSKDEIRRSQAVNLQEFFKTRLPMNTVQRSGNQAAGAADGALSSVSLRGLSASQTLILMDGRRLPSVFIGGAVFGQPDINGVPLAMIERIEVLPSTASGIYGGGATGGVINIITRQDYAGADVMATYANAFKGNVSSRRLDLSAGFNLEEGRTHVLFAAAHVESDGLLVGDRDFAVRGRALQFANNPAAFLASAPPAGYTSNIVSVDRSNLVLDNGTPLGSPRTFVPTGYLGGDGGAALVPNAGLYTLDLPDASNGTGGSLLTDPDLVSASLNLRREFGARVSAYVDFSSMRNRNVTIGAGVPGNTTLPANAPNNPFTTAINVRFPAPNVNLFTQSSSEIRRTAMGLIVRLPRKWIAAADYSWSRSRTGSLDSGPIINADGNAALANGTLDVVRDLNVAPLNYSPYLLPLPNNIGGPYDTLLKTGTLRLSGSVLRLPGGPLALSTLVERREERGPVSYFETMSNTGVRSIFFRPDRAQNVDSFYLEARAPVFESLEMQVSARRDAYETISSPGSTPVVSSRTAPRPMVVYTTNKIESTDYTFGVKYSPIADMSLRASYGTGFLPPGVAQIVDTNRVDVSVNLTDPKRGGVSRTVIIPVFSSGGNPNLLPEESRSWSAGIILTPRFLPDLRLSVDYTRIRKLNEVTNLSEQTFLDLEGSLPGRVTRAALTPADIALRYTGGAITAMNATAVNIASTRLEAYDVQTDYTFDAGRYGRFHAYAIATYQPQFERQTLPTEIALDNVGFNNGVLERRGNAGITWDRDALTVGWNAQYYNSYLGYGVGSTNATIAAFKLNQGTTVIAHQVYHDLIATYRFGQIPASYLKLFSDSELALGIQNLFDKSPPILALTGSTAGYSTFGDPRLRRYSISLRKSFQ